MDFPKIQEEMSKNWSDHIVIFTDGACRGNPGPSSLGFVVFCREKEEKIYRYGEYLGKQTNNFAEYKAVYKALEVACKRQVKSVLIKSDSQFLVRQMQGVYKVKSPSIKVLFSQCQKLISSMNKVEFQHVYREDNVEADALANEVLDLVTS